MKNSELRNFHNIPRFARKIRKIIANIVSVTIATQITRKYVHTDTLTRKMSTFLRPSCHLPPLRATQYLRIAVRLITSVPTVPTHSPRYSWKTTIFGQEKTNENCPYCTFPYPVLQLEEHRNQCAKNPRFRQRIRKPAQPVEMEPSPGGEMELKLSTARIGGLTPSMSDSTNKLREIYSQRDPSPHESKQQQVGRGVTRDDMYPNKQQQSHRRDSLSYYQEKYQQQNIRKQQQEPTKRTVTSPILRFEGTHQQYNTSKQQQQQAIKKTLSPPTIPYEGTHQQYNTSKQQQQQRATPSPTSLFRGREDSQFAFSNMTQNPTSNIPHDFKCEIKSIQVPTKRNPINKPTDLPIPNKHTNKFFPLTPTQDVPNFSNRFETSQRPNYDSMKIRYPPVSSSPNCSLTQEIISLGRSTLGPPILIVPLTRNSVSSFQDKYKSPKTKVLREIRYVLVR